ncbi:MAG: phosphopantetheine-binding protein, partial [Cyanobacteria bacterium J06639_18]
MGRIDDQAKIRGFRVEPAEIESYLNQHPEVKASVVIVREDMPGDKRLVAYYVPAGNREQGTGNREQDAIQNSLREEQSSTKFKTQNSTPPLPTPHSPLPIRQYLSTKLPHYLVPSSFVQLKALPLTPNGKVDVRSLPVPSVESPQASYVAPLSETEVTLAAIFAEVLDAERVGLHDDFFELGGHSLLATQLVAQLLK